MATAARLLLLLLVLTPCSDAAAQTMPELAAVLMAFGEHCGEPALAADIEARYSGSREFQSEVRFRRESEPTGPAPEACASARKPAHELARLDAQADASPWPGASSKGQDGFSYRRVYAVRAGAAAARAWLCSLDDLTTRLSSAYPTDVNYQQSFLMIQQAGLDLDRPLRCADSERRARQLIVILQHLELPRTTDPLSAHTRIQCLLPGLRITIPMAGSDCAERRGKVFETFTKLDEDYDPETERE